MKAIMLSIQPKYCELIASGEKTIEVRKTAPKLGMPFKCYIYCTNGQMLYDLKDETYLDIDRRYAIGENKSNKVERSYPPFVNRKVIGEFVCDYINKYEYSTIDGVDIDDDELLETMLDREEINIYVNGKDLYGWHITDLKIYDTPKELGDFTKPCPFNEDCDLICPHAIGEYHGDGINGDMEFVGCGLKITRPPQSWCYCEELNG